MKKRKKRDNNTIKTIIIYIVTVILTFAIMYSLEQTTDYLLVRRHISAEKIKWIDEINKSGYIENGIKLSTASNIDINGKEYVRIVLKDNKGQIIFNGDWIEKGENEEYGLSNQSVQLFYIIKRLFKRKENLQMIRE